ncbi:acyl-CoA-binding protein-like [Anopheles cruzii]|uniref:acyl-CoA-binding protein-like n=1 Tax=Anopheles cruzii TaxID=68878 RepID=UPI0022EC7974|nr:acyl-CoA-binding protein-like [Anopheles cruzii]
MLDTEDDIPFGDSLEDQDFVKATKYVERNTWCFTQHQLLSFYALYKQATVGSCTIPIPSILHPQARAKWYAWNKLQQIDKASAKSEYVRLLDDLKPAWDCSRGSGWVSVSRPKRQEDECIDETEEYILTTYIKDGCLDGIEDTRPSWNAYCKLPESMLI